MSLKLKNGLIFVTIIILSLAIVGFKNYANTDYRKLNKDDLIKASCVINNMNYSYKVVLTDYEAKNLIQMLNTYESIKECGDDTKHSVTESFVLTFKNNNSIILNLTEEGFMITDGMKKDIKIYVKLKWILKK